MAGELVVECELECGHGAEHRVAVDTVDEADLTGLFELLCLVCGAPRVVTRRRMVIEPETRGWL